MRQLKIVKAITNRETSSVDKYLQDIGKEELITADEEVRLAEKIRQGDQIALEKLVKANLRFVVSVAKQYQNQGLKLPDLISEGNLGLIKAAQRFDEKRGFKFISYAVWWIRQSILQALAEQARTVRLPLNQIGSINKLDTAWRALEQKYERDPTIEELSKLLEISETKITDMLRNKLKSSSTDEQRDPEDPGSDFFSDHVDPEEITTDSGLTKESLQKQIEFSLQTITQKEADVLRLHFGLGGMPYPMSLEEIGEKIDLTRERVRQIKEKALRKLRHKSKSNLLKQYLG